MSKFIVDFEGYALVEADSAQEAADDFWDQYLDYQDIIDTSVVARGVAILRRRNDDQKVYSRS